MQKSFSNLEDEADPNEIELQSQGSGSSRSQRDNSIDNLPHDVFEEVMRKASSQRSLPATKYHVNDVPRFESASTRRLNEILRRNAEKNHYMLHPMSNFNSVWTFLNIVILAYIALVVPVFVAFSHLYLPPNFVVLDVLIDIFYMFDVIIIFRTGIIPNEKRPDIVIMDPYEVAKQYLKTWLIVDLLCSIPFALIGLFVQSSLPQNSVKLAKLLKITKLLRVAKLTKLGKANQYMDRIEEFYLDLIVSHPHVITVLRMLSNTIVGFLVIHYLACLWWLVGKLHDNNWIGDAGMDDKPSGEQYLTSVYWVITTMTTVGYGDISPVNGSERAFGIVVMVSGCTLYGLLIAKITSIVGEYEANRRMIAEKMDAVALYIHKKRIHPKLRKQILVYFRFFFKKNSILDEAQMLTDLSSRLREKVILHLVSSVVTNNPFFLELNHHITELYHIMQLQIYHRGQHIVHKGEKSEDMFVLLVGRAVILDQSKPSIRAGRGRASYPLYEVYPGATFGEKCALGLEDHFQVTVRALTNCEIYLLTGEALMNLIGPEHVRRIRQSLKYNTKFKVKLRTYHIANIHSEDTERMNHVVLSLPIDHITRSWCTVVSDSRAKLKQSLSNDDLGVDNAVKSNYTIKEENEQQLKLLAKQTLSGEEDDDDKEEDGENKEMSLTSSTSTGNVQGDVQAGEVESLTQEIKQVKLDMNDIISLLNKSIKDNNDQLEELKGMIQSVVLSLSST